MPRLDPFDLLCLAVLGLVAYGEYVRNRRTQEMAQTVDCIGNSAVTHLSDHETRLRRLETPWYLRHKLPRVAYVAQEA